MKKAPPVSSLTLKLASILYKIAYYCVSFFILIGQSTEFIAGALVRLPLLLVHYGLKFATELSKNLSKYFTLSAKKISKIATDLWDILTAKAAMIRPVRYAKKETKSKFVFPTLPKLSLNIPVFKIPKISLPAISLPRLPKIKLLKNIKLAPFKYIGLKIRYFILGCLITALIVMTVQSYLFVKSLPSPTNIGKVNFALSTHIYDRNGAVLYEIYDDQNRTPVSLKDLPAYVSQASVAIEDKDFYRHNGISIVSGVFRALREIVLNKSLQGGSTITQQLVKASLLTPERTIQRKIKEAILAVWAERIYSKNQILEMYLNQVPFGGSAYGIEEASKVYFNKDAKDLTLVEAATLAGLPQAPSIYSPYVNPELAVQRRNEVLQNMYKENYISLKQKNEGIKASLEVQPLKTKINAPHFVFYVKGILEDEYGSKQVEEGGLHVKTTLDLKVQKEAEKILKEELEKIQYLNVTNGGILVTKPDTGEIIAMVGSVDYFAQPSGAFNVTTALRQPGSSIKPLTYSLALEKGFTPATIINDSPVTFNISGSESYKPVNYDGKFRGPVPLRFALANSLNIPAVRVLSALGVDSLVNHAKKMGISTWGDSSRYGLSLTLGGGEVTMIDMTKAFGVFANEGYKTDISPIDTIEDSDKQNVYTYEPTKTKVLNEGVAYLISDILSDNAARQSAFGAHSALEIPGYKVAVKTGTTDWKKDNWTVGYTPEYLVAVWVGNNDNTPMNQYLASGITGAAPIWNRVMSYVLKNDPNGNKWLTKPEDVVERNCFGRTEVFLRGTENTVSCQLPPSPKPTNKP